MEDVPASAQIDAIIRKSDDRRGLLLSQLRAVIRRADLNSKTVRAIDYHEDEAIDAAALTALIEDAVKLNAST